MYPLHSRHHILGPVLHRCYFAHARSRVRAPATLSLVRRHGVSQKSANEGHGRHNDNHDHDHDHKHVSIAHGHSHGGGGHGHAHGGGLIDTSSAEGTRITIIGLASNVILTVGKGFGGIVWGSASLLADAVHSLLDLVSDFVTLFTFRKARASVDAHYPYGYGKLEPLGSLTISGLLLTGGVGAGYHSFQQLRESFVAAPDQPSIIDAISMTDSSVSVLAFSAIAASIVVKEALFWATLRVAEKTGSDVLVANAWHHRADSISSFVALIGTGGAALGYPLLDPIGGILVSGMIVQASAGMLLPALQELSDSAPKDVLESVSAVVAEVAARDDSIVRFSTIRGRKMGPSHLVDLQLQVDPRISVSQSHQIAENVRHAILARVRNISEVLVHIDVEEHDHLSRPRATEEPTSRIEEEIAKSATKGLESEVKRVSHISVHYFSDGMEVDMEIIPANGDTISFKDAAAIAQKLETQILMYPGVKAADVHLESKEYRHDTEKRRRHVPS